MQKFCIILNSVAGNRYILIINIQYQLGGALERKRRQTMQPTQGSTQRLNRSTAMTRAIVYTALVNLYRRERLATEKTRTLHGCVICYQSIRNRPSRSPMILSLQGS